MTMFTVEISAPGHDLTPLLDHLPGAALPAPDRVTYAIEGRTAFAAAARAERAWMDAVGDGIERREDRIELWAYAATTFLIRPTETAVAS